MRCRRPVRVRNNGGAPDDLAVFFRVNGGQRSGNSKIGDLQPVVFGDQHVVGFDIAMDQSRPVGIANSGASLSHQANRVFNAEMTSLSDQGFEVGAVNVFHHDENLVSSRPKS